MTRRTQQTSFSDLSLDIFELILDHLATITWNAAIKATLARCARVASSWTHPTLARLYARLHVNGARQARTLAQSGAFKRYPRRYLEFSVMRGEGWSEAEEIISFSEGVKELWLGSTCTAVPIDLLRHPSLKDVEALTIHCAVDNSSYLASVPFPFRLKRLSIQPFANPIPVLRAISTCCTCGEAKPSLTSLTLFRTLTQFSLLGLSPVAPFLTTLVLPVVVLREPSPNDPIPLISNFLSLATAVSRLSFSFYLGTGYFRLGSCLAILLASIKPPLATLELAVCQGIMTHDSLAMITGALSSWKGLENLTELKFPELGSDELESVPGSDALRSLLLEKDTFLSTRVLK